MDNDQTDLKAKIFYYLREKYYNSMIAASKEGIAKFKDDVSFHLYHALGLMAYNRIEECINELDLIKNENDVKLSVIIALIYAHKSLKGCDREILLKLDAQMKDFRKSAEAIDYYYSGLVLFVLNKFDKAIDYLDKALNIQSNLTDAMTLKGWVYIELRKVSEKYTQNVTELFETSIMSNKRNLDATLGIIQSYLYKNNFEEAVNTVNKAVVRFPNSHLPLIQKMKIQFASQQWDQTIETMNRIINNNSNDLDVLKTKIVLLLARDANFEETIIQIKNYIAQIEQQEPKNGKLLLYSAKLFSVICGRNNKVLKETYQIMEKAVKTDPENIDFIIELGNQCLLLEKIKEAQKYYKSATKLNETSFNALIGLSMCELIENGKTEQIQKQINFLSQLQPNSKLYFIKAKIANNSDEALLFLNKSCDLQLNAIKSCYYSDVYLEILNPDFLLNVIKEYIKYISASFDLNSKVCSNKSAEAVKHVLKVITKACPGLYEGFYLLAKIQYFNGETQDALNVLEGILTKTDASWTEAYLLTALIQVQSGFNERAAQTLEIGLSNYFKVRENPIYHFIRGLVDKNDNNLQDCLKSLSTALSLINSEISLTEKASIFVELIEVNNALGQADEATKLLEDALEIFHGTQEEARILILSADHALKRKNIQGAIDLLNKIEPNGSYYLQARTKLADILLKYRMDKYAYLQCYQEMVDENPGSDTYLLLGDAYMNILEPDDALEYYRQALQQNPKDPYLTSRMGKALVETHYFSKAVAFYKDSIKTTQNSELKLQLADLYMQLKQYDKAEILLINEIETEDTKMLEDLTYLQHKTKLLVLLAQTQEKSANLSGALSTLKDAKDNQNRIRKRLALEQNVVPANEINLLVEIGMKLGEISVTLKNNDQAIQFYKDAIEVSSNDISVLTALAKLYMQINVLEPCQQICSNILQIDPENETASVMMADIAFRKIDFDMALFHFTQLLNKQPTNWAALVRLVEVMRRTGNISNAPEYLKSAENNTTNPSKDPNLLFCTALYQWYSGNVNGALRNFNGARQDPEWGQSALRNMIEICLNPDDEMLGDQFMDSEDLNEYRDSRSMALKTADRLLKELKQRLEASGEDLIKYRLLVNFRLLATQEKPNIERGLEDFIQIGTQNAYKDLVGPILGMATAYSLLKQSQRAKNQLKRVAKSSWTFEEAEYLERCWLLLADYYIQSAKLEVASELLNKVVQHNKACCKAYEYLGFICEKEQRYSGAANHYESAWVFGGRCNPSIGYKLAYSLMKCKNYADAIDIGKQVLKVNPDYPKIRKDILEKAMNNLRV